MRHWTTQDERRIHGLAAQSVLVAFLVVAANVRKIRAFMSFRPSVSSTNDPAAEPRNRLPT